MKKVISKYGFTYSGVSLDPVSQTVPDQSLSVEEILRRFTTGTLTEGEIVRQHQYGEDLDPTEDADNMNPEYDPDFDLVDAYELAQSAESLRAELQTRQTSRKQSAANAEPQLPPSPPSESNNGE